MAEADFLLKTGEENAACLSFSPDGSRLPVCLRHEVEMWSMGTRSEKLMQIPCLGSQDSSFSADGRFGNCKRVRIWDATGTDRGFFDSTETKPQDLSLSETQEMIQSC